MKKLLLALLLYSGIASAQHHPNILLIMTDDMGYWDTGISGNPHIDTPSLDQLARDGVQFTRFHAASVCAPTRAGVMTGRYYLRTGLYNTRFGGDTLGKDESTIADALRANGYRTGLFGKWHLGKYSGYQPQQRGFEEFFGHYHGHIERYENPDQVVHNGEPVETRGYVSELFADAAMDFMGASQAAEKPFFCFLSFNAPHSPWTLDTSHAHQAEGDKLLEKYLERGLPIREARIYALVERVDQNVGRVSGFLEESGLAENTAVFFMSDNGGVSKFWKGGLNGNKASSYEGGTRSPLFAKYPGRFPAGGVVTAQTSHVDLFMTFVNLAGMKMELDRPMDGKSLLPLLYAGKGEHHHEYVYHTWDRYFPNPDNRWAISDERWKLLCQVGTGVKGERKNWRLFDLQNDPGESKNLVGEHPEIVERLRTEFVRWFDEVTDGVTYAPAPIPVGDPAENPVEIQPSWAKWEGKNIEYVFEGYDWDTIEGWRDAGEKATWNLDVVKGGVYEIELEYGCRPADAGGLLTIDVGENQIQFRPTATPTANVFKRVKIGEVELQAGEQLLTAECHEAAGTELMRLNKIWLRRR
ncbi:MAG: arylsulfatase A-like enzyme [Verrucomicrobiales bacterium]